MGILSADFEVADDMLREAALSRLAGRGRIVIEKSGRIAPIIEIALATRQFSDQYRSVSINSPFAKNLRQALKIGLPFGSGYEDVAGAFPLKEMNPVLSCEGSWDQWTLHANNIAKSKGLNSQVVASLLGALGEIQDNVYEHSGAPQTGLVAYAVTATSFEFVVADGGVGVLQTLRQNPKYYSISDAGKALQEIIQDGVSRFPSEAGRGQGFNQLFRALVGQNVEIRLRSGDHALTLMPSVDPLHGKMVLAQQAPLNGLAVSVFYRVRGL